MLGFYALSVMEREGAIYGYSLADRISDRTDGAWRPGAGAIYPALRSLVDRGLARETSEGRRRLYRITPSGRALLRGIRARWRGAARTGPDLGMLWSEIAGSTDPGQHYLLHLRHHLEGITRMLERDPSLRAGRARLADQVRAELRVTESRLAALPSAERRGTRPKRGS